MSDTLRDQLMGLGFKPAPKPERKNDGPAVMVARRARVATAMESRRALARASTSPASVVGMATAAASRPVTWPRPAGPAQAAQRRRDGPGQGLRHPRAEGKEERIETERLKQEEARVRREAKAKLEELLKDKSLNSEAAISPATSHMAARSSASM